MLIGCIVLAVALVTTIGISLWHYKKTQKEVDKLIQYLSKVQDSLELPEMEDIKEGSLSILQSEIYKVVALLRQSYSVEYAQKKYMADMLSDISHQIKTPLTAISVMTELLEQPELEEEKRLEYVSKIDKQVGKITWLIRNLLTLSQLEANVIELKKESVNVKEMLEQIRDTFEIMAEVKMVNLALSVDPAIDMQCDRRWTIEALSNIVKNCIEHTEPEGYVKVWVKQDNIATHIHIEDNGEGIAEEHLEHIFDRFYKVDKAKSDSIGIGLAMAKQIIMKQEGTISLESEVGRGSHFYIV